MLYLQNKIKVLIRDCNNTELSKIMDSDMAKSKAKKLLRRLVRLSHESNIIDEYANDGDGRFDTWQSDELRDILASAEKITKELKLEEPKVNKSFKFHLPGR